METIIVVLLGVVLFVEIIILMTGKKGRDKEQL